jgi:hypothetical protein
VIFLIPAVIAALLVNKNQVLGGNVAGSVAPGPVPDNISAPRIAPSATSPVIHNSVGASLSQALGNKANTPGYYSTGNPSVGKQVPSSTHQFYKRVKPYPIGKPTGHFQQPTISNPGQSGVTQYAPAKPRFQNSRRTNGLAYKQNSVLTNPIQAPRVTTAPEWPAAFWTQPNIYIKGKSKT